MTEYYTNKSDFEKGKNLGFMENNVQQVVDLLNDISKAATIVQDNDLADLYIAQGGATLGKEMPEKDFLEAEHKVLKIMDALKDIHREVVQNIENKYISGLEDAVEALNKVNEGKNQYKSDHLTYEETTTTYINNGLAGPVEQTSTDTKHFTLSDILNSDKSPIPAAAAKYNEKLKVAKERLKDLEQSDKETYNKIKDLTDRKLVDSFYPTEMGEYKRLKSTWSKDNEQWLGWVENGVKIVGVGLLVVGSIASGGTLAPVAFGTGTALLGGEALYRAGVGETISGDVLSTEQRWWAGAEAVTTLASGGLSTATKVAGTTASESLLAAEKFAHMSANVYDAAQFGHDFMEDPQMALTNLATSQMIGRTIGHLGSKYKAYRASQTGNVDIHSGEATSFKTNLKEQANTAWTDIKTKAGDVKVQVGEGFDNFKNRVSNVKNQAISASTEGLSNKVRNFSDAIETGHQNIHNTLDSLGNKNRLAFVTVDDVPVDLPKSKVSTKMDDLADRIQQISVEHKQKIEAFEGRGGNRSSKSLLNKDGIFDNPELEERYQKYVQGKQKLGIEANKIRDRLDWKEASDYYTQNSPIARGNRFNKTVKESDLYQYHEVNLENGKRLDSYDPDFGEIISRKATDLDKIQEKTFRGYLQEIHDKYSVGETIRSNAYPELDGLKLEGKYILEVPATNRFLPDIERYKNIAREYDVELRFTEE